MKQTLGHLLINDILPPEHRVEGPMGKSVMTKTLTAVAKADPVKYVDVVSRLKRLGDEVATLEGTSVGLDDIAPVYSTRDEIIRPGVEALKRAKTRDEREKIIIDIQDKIAEHTKRHPGTMAVMAKSGARGNYTQLLKTVATPVAAVNSRGEITPWLIEKSYSEGLSPADYWVTGNEARINTVKSSTSVSEPGDVSKIVVNTLYPMIVSQDDCGTQNGIALSSTDHHALDRYLSKAQQGHSRNELVTPRVMADVADKSPYIYVRSPMTCEAHEGVCRKCQGLDEKGRPHALGVNVGVRAANAISEPLTQFALNAKHGVRVLKGKLPKLEGLQGLRQLLDIPQSFFNKAPLASVAGEITKIEPAPHGGTYIHVGDQEHYAGPAQPVTVQLGQLVEAGDRLAEGIPKPDEVVYHKGLGVGREYLVDSLHDLYKAQNLDVDKRHFELLAKADLNHVQLLDAVPAHPHLLRGDYLPYEEYKRIAAEKTEPLPLDRATGHVLGKEVLHFTTGTPLTPSILATLKKHGVAQVDVSHSAPRVEFIMRPIQRTPLLDPDWMSRLAHRFLKDSLLHGAHFGDSTSLHGAHPIPAYAYGAEFGQGPEGRY